jgi:hypothetical protein
MAHTQKKKIYSIVWYFLVDKPTVYDAEINTYDVKNLQISGLTLPDRTSMKLYMRQEAKMLWKELENSANGATVLVTGCSGVGKSIVVFAQTIHNCWNNNKSLLYYHSDSKKFNCFVMDRSKNVQLVHNSSPKFVRLNRNNYDVAVVDGTHEPSEMNIMFKSFPDDKKLVVCTSYQAVKISQETEYNTPKEKLIQWTVCSWTWEDYYCAATAGCFSFEQAPNEQQLTEIIDYRFKICGGSVRLFSGDPTQAINSIKESLKRVKDYQLFYDNKLGDKSADAVNRLMALYRDDNDINSIPLSQFVFEELANKCGGKEATVKFIQDARKAMPNNPSWQGWVTEYEVVAILRLYKSLVVHYDVDGETNDTLLCSDLIQLNLNESLKLHSEYNTNSWILPYKWNQALWDAVQILNDGMLGIRQITSGATHTNKFSHLHKLIDETKCKNVKFLTICRRNNFEVLQQVHVGLPSNIEIELETVWYDELPSEDQEPQPHKKQRTV